MLGAFGFIRFSCSLLVRCFLKSKRRRRDGRQGSDSDDEEPIYKPKSHTAKIAISRVIRIRPPKPMARPKIASFLSFLLKGKSYKSPSLQNPPESTVVVRDIDVRNRRVGNKFQTQDVTETVASVCWQSCDADSDDVSIDGLSSHMFGRYASDIEASDEASDVDSVDFDVDSDIAPRSSSESMPRQGINPTFYEGYASEEEDPMTFKQTPMKRLQSVVDLNHDLKNQSMSSATSQLLTNPAYGMESKETSEDGDDCQTETKLKSLKSVVKSGCLALPTSTALVGNQYIGHTSLNLTYGDVTSSESDDEDTDASSKGHVDRSNSHIDRSYIDRLSLDQDFTMTPRSLPLLSFRGLAESDATQKMGTLTWRNMAYSPRDSSDPDECPSKTVADFQIRWKQNLSVENEHIPGIPSTTVTAGTSSEDKGITRLLVTPIRSISDNVFEDIDFKRQTVQMPYIPQIPHSQSKSRSSSPGKHPNFWTTGLRHTRWALRSLNLLLDRVDVFAADKKK